MKSVLMQHMRTTNIPTSITGLTFNQDGKTVTPSQGASPSNLQYNFYYLFEDRVIDLSSKSQILNAFAFYYYDENGLGAFNATNGPTRYGINFPNGKAYFYLDGYGYVVINSNLTYGRFFIGDELHYSADLFVNANNKFFTFAINNELRKYFWSDYVPVLRKQGTPDANLIPYNALAEDKIFGTYDLGFSFYYGVGMADQSFSIDVQNTPYAISGITEGIVPIVSIFAGMSNAGFSVLIDAISQSAMHNYPSNSLSIDNTGQLFSNSPNGPVTVTHYNGTSDNVFGVMFADSSLFNQISSGWHVFPAFGKLYALLNLGGPFYELYENGPSHINWEYSLTYQPLILQNYKLGVK